MELKNYSKPKQLNIYLYNYQTETAIFLATKHEKTIMTCSQLNFLKLFPSFQTFGTQYYKNESIHLNSWKHRSYLLILLSELELLSENDFEAVLVNFRCYKYIIVQCFRGSSEAKISTQGLCWSYSNSLNSYFYSYFLTQSRRLVQGHWSCISTH